VKIQLGGVFHQIGLELVLQNFRSLYRKFRYSHDTIGPLTNHIMWTKPIQSGGVVGETTLKFKAILTLRELHVRQSFLTNNNERQNILQGANIHERKQRTYHLRNLRTGKLVWSRADVPALSFGCSYPVHTSNTQGVFGVLYTNNFARAFDPDTGEPLYNVTGVPSGTA